MAVLPDLEEIARLRRALGLSQTRLASLAGVSQSTIAKIERKQVNPSYEAVRRILDSLEGERKRKQRVASVADVRTRKVVSLPPSAPLEGAVAEMRRHRYSQLPVIDAGRPVGSIGERTIATLLMEGRTARDLAQLRVLDVMEPSFPAIDERAPVALAASLLNHYAAVLTTHRGEISGIVTKSDLLKLI